MTRKFLYILFLLLFGLNTASQAWWQCRRRLTVENTSEDDTLWPGHSVYFPINHGNLRDAGKSNWDGSDVRIVYEPDYRTGRSRKVRVVADHDGLNAYELRKYVS